MTAPSDVRLWCLSRVWVSAVPERVGTLRLRQATNRLSPSPGASPESSSMRQEDGVQEGGVATSQLLTGAIDGRRHGLLV
jgi:hypothetical protein